MVEHDSIRAKIRAVLENRLSLFLFSQLELDGSD